MSGNEEGASYMPIAVFIFVFVISTIYIGFWLVRRNKLNRKPKTNLKGTQSQATKKKGNTTQQTKKKSSHLKSNHSSEVKHNLEHSHLLTNLKGHSGQLTGGEFSSNGKYFITSSEVVKACSYVAGGKKEDSTNDFMTLNHSDNPRWNCNNFIHSNPPSDTEDSLTSTSSCGPKLSRRQKKNKKKKKKNLANININFSSNTDDNNNSSDNISNNINNSNNNNKRNNDNIKNNCNSNLNINMVNDTSKNINKKHKNFKKNQNRIYPQRNETYKCSKYFGRAGLELHSLLLPSCVSVEDRILNGYPYETYIGIYVYKALGFSRLEAILGDNRLVKEEIQDFNVEDSYDVGEHFPLHNLMPMTVFNNIKNTSSNSPYIKNYQKCMRCRQYFDIWVNGITPCFYHPKKAILTSEGTLKYACCNLSKMDSGCFISNFHVFHHLSLGINGPLFGYISTKSTSNRPPTVFGLDCEMVFTTQGFEVARATLVNVQKEPKLDIFIQPEGQILDYNTHFSGIKEHHLAKALPFYEAQQMILQLVSSSDILVGHSLEGDLVVLKILHRRVVDTSLLFKKNFNDSNSHTGSSLPCRQTLKSLVKEYLDQDIQKGGSEGHNSVEDATAALNLVLNLIVSSDSQKVF